MAVDYEKLQSQSDRYMVRIQCPECGEKFLIRGGLNPDGTIRADVKMCFCGNQNLQITPA